MDGSQLLQTEKGGSFSVEDLVPGKELTRWSCCGLFGNTGLI